MKNCKLNGMLKVMGQSSWLQTMHWSHVRVHGLVPLVTFFFFFSDYFLPHVTIKGMERKQKSLLLYAFIQKI